MNFRLISRILGGILLYFTLSMVFSLVWSYALSEDQMVRAFIYSGMIGLGISGCLFWAGRGASKLFLLKEGIVVVSFGWILCALVAALPFYLSGLVPNFVDAFFESMSGLTTTGATILSGLDTMPKGFLFWRHFLQWLGGMGIIVLFVAVLPVLGVSGRFLYRLEVPGVTKEELKPQIQQAASILWKIYILFSVVLFVCLWLAGMTLFDAACHTFTTMATGGFSTHDQSIAYFQSPLIEWILILFMFLAGINFSLHFVVFRGGFTKLFRDMEWRFYTFIIIVMTALICLILAFSNIQSAGFDTFHFWMERFRMSAFHVVSIITTTGYATADFALWPGAAQLLLIGLMFCGGCAGSTGGGMKVYRFMVSLKSLHLGVHQFIRPRMVKPIRLGNHTLSEDIHLSIQGFFLTYITIFFLCSLFMAMLGLDPVTATSSVIASMGNVGPGLAKVGPAFSWEFLPDVGKIVLAFCMMVGRLELYTALAIFLPVFWKNN